MPSAAAIGAAAVIGGIVTARGQNKAAKSQEQASNQAITLAKEQEAERKREYDQQQAAAAYQWKVMQANLAPYRAARASVLSKYGINTSVDEPPMPKDFGMPGGPTPTTGGVVSPRGDRGNLALLAGAGLASGLGAYGQYKMQHPKGPQEVAGPPSSMIRGGPIPTPSVVDPSSLYNWSDWSNYYGVPGQEDYLGE